MPPSEVASNEPSAPPDLMPRQLAVGDQGSRWTLVVQSHRIGPVCPSLIVHSKSGPTHTKPWSDEPGREYRLAARLRKWAGTHNWSDASQIATLCPFYYLFEINLSSSKSVP